MHTISTGKATLVGGGIASLAAAVYLIRDAGFEGGDIRILEADHVLGGSLDGTGNDTDGYLVRGGRMFEAHYGVPMAGAVLNALTTDCGIENGVPVCIATECEPRFSKLPGTDRMRVQSIALCTPSTHDSQ